jgi:hypothetical protein
MSPVFKNCVKIKKSLDLFPEQIGKDSVFWLAAVKTGH